MRFDWSKMGRMSPTALVGARVLAHRAAQWPSRAARANLKSVPDDSHSSLTWDAGHASLVCRPLPARGGEVRVGLRVGRLELIFTRGVNVLDAFQFDGKTDAAAGAWADAKLLGLGLRPAGSVPLPYALPAHVPMADAPHDLSMLGRELGELSRWFGGAAEVLEEFRAKSGGLRPGPSPVRCWPHHFDIATLVGLAEGNDAPSLGVGVSPGDEYYAQPYVYVSPSARFDTTDLPRPPPPGHWHTEGFFGIVATGDDILAMKDRGRGLLAFIVKSFEIGRARVSA
jgi:hypothetical protein